MNTNDNAAVIRWTVYATIVQVAMVLAGHFNDFVRNNVFAIGGMTISLLFGGLCAMRVATRIPQALAHGTIVGGVSALLGIAISVLLEDVPAAVLLFGTTGSAMAGLIGGGLFFAVRGKRSTSASTAT